MVKTKSTSTYLSRFLTASQNFYKLQKTSNVIRFLIFFFWQYNECVCHVSLEALGRQNDVLTCSPRISSINTSEEHARNVYCWVPPRPTDSETLGVGPSSHLLISPPIYDPNKHKNFENHQCSWVSG